MKQPKFAVIGGDLRIKAVAQQLKEEGYFVSACLQEQKDFYHWEKEAKEILTEADIVLLPLPLSSDDKTIQHTPLSFEQLFQFDSPFYLGGMASPRFLNLVREKNIHFQDYFLREELNILNAIPTAEGAIAIAMEELPVTLHGSKCLILGFGRIGKILAKILQGMGAQVTCTARKESDLAWIKANGYHPLRTDKINHELFRFDVIFNTVPALLLSEENLHATKPEVLLIDLASKPGGIDFISAGKLERKAIWALSLPGKVAPLTAGTIIKDTVLHILQEQNMI